MTDPGKSSLDGLRVLDLSTEHAGALLAMLLADHGAEVVVAGAGVSGYAGRGRRRIVDVGDEDLAALRASADVVVEDTPRAMTGQGRPARQIHVHLPPFDPDHPLADMPGFDGFVEACAAMQEVPLGRRPVYSSFPAISVVSALYGVVGVMGALIARSRDGLGQQVTVARSDVAYALLELNAMLTVSPPKAWASLQWATTPFIAAFEARDGRHLYLHAGLRKHTRRLLEVFDALESEEAATLRQIISPGTLADPTSVASIGENRRISRQLDAIFARRDAAEWDAALAEAGLCAVVVERDVDWLDHPHALASGQVREGGPGLLFDLERNPGAVGREVATSVEEVRAAWGDVAVEEKDVGDRVAVPPLKGVRVLDLTQVIAGPTAARTLAELGADVLRVENPHFDAPWVEAFHVAFNPGKRSVVIDLTTEAGRVRFWEVVEGFAPEVVVQNLRPGAADAMGIGEADLRARIGEVVYAHLTAYGDAGPYSDRPGWEQTAQALTGIQARYGGDGPPALFPMAFNDVGTGLAGAAATLMAIYARKNGGARGQRVSAALSATATLMQAPTLFDGATGATGSEALGTGPLHRFYKCDGGWIFLSAEALGEEAPAVLSGVVGLEGVAGVGRGALEAALEGAFLRARPERWVARIREAGLVPRVGVGVRMTQRAFLRDPRAHARGMLHRRAHEGLGEVLEVGCPLTLERTRLEPLGPAAPREDLAGGRSPGLAQTVGWLKRQAVGGVVHLLKKRER